MGVGTPEEIVAVREPGHRHDGLRAADARRPPRPAVHLRGEDLHQTGALRGRRRSARSELRLPGLRPLFASLSAAPLCRRTKSWRRSSIPSTISASTLTPCGGCVILLHLGKGSVFLLSRLSENHRWPTPGSYLKLKECPACYLRAPEVNCTGPEAAAGTAAVRSEEGSVSRFLSVASS